MRFPDRFIVSISRTQLERVLFPKNIIYFYHEDNEGLEDITALASRAILRLSFIIFIPFMVKKSYKHCIASAPA
jgi:hypothetical protein